MAMDTLQDLLEDELKDLYSAEKQAIRVYPKIAKGVETEELKQALQEHLEQTKGQLERLDQVFEILEKRAGGKTCEAMKGLIEEGQEVLEEGDKGAVRDAAIIGSAQRMEHYEIAAYGTVISFAKTLGHDDIANLLAQTLEEEKATDEKLTQIAEQVNQAALGEGEEEEDDEEEEQEDDEEEKPAKKAAKKAPAKKSSGKK